MLVPPNTLSLQAVRNQGGMWCERALPTPRGATSSALTGAGWHMSWFMQPTGVLHKLESFSHTELNTAGNRNTDALWRRMLLVCLCAPWHGRSKKTQRNLTRCCVPCASGPQDCGGWSCGRCNCAVAVHLVDGD